MKSTKILLTGCMLWLAFAAAAQPVTHYVHLNAPGSNDGTSWTNAFTTLQAAVDAAAPGDSVWVATGTYYPTKKFNGDSARNATFYINKDVLIFGGFSGSPGTEGLFSERNTILHPTVLSGDIGVPLDSTDNLFHVVYIDHVSDTMRLDGVIIERGNTSGAAGFDAYGAGIFNNARETRSNPVIANCIIRHNYASEGGGGIMNFAELGGTGNPRLISCRIEQNEASGGGGMQNYTDTEGETSPVIISTYFRGNTARTAQGSAISAIAHSAVTAPRMINSIVTGNHATSSAAFDAFVTGTGAATPVFVSSVFTGNSTGAIRVSDLGQSLSSVTVRNSILFSNPNNHGLSVNGATEDIAYSITQFGSGGEGVIMLNPEFVDPPAAYPAPHIRGDVHLLPTSPGLDAGRNSDFPLILFGDAAGNPRIVNSTGLTEAIIDIGAFEYQDVISSTRDVFVNLAGTVSPNPVTDQVVIELQEEGEFRCYLFDMQGSLIREFTLSGNARNQLNVVALPQGAYTILATQGNYLANMRFVKE